MVLFFFLIGLGWMVTSLAQHFLEVILDNYFPKANKATYVILILLVGMIITLLSYTFLFSLENNTFTEVYNSGSTEDNTPPAVSPFEVKVSHTTLGETTFDMRNVTDTVLLGVIGKTVVGAMGKTSRISGKIALGMTAAISAVAGVIKHINNYRKYTPSSSGTTPSSSGTTPPNDNNPLNSSLESSIFENIGGLLSMVSILLTLTLLLFVVLVLLLLFERNFPSLDFKNNFITKDLSRENLDWFVNKIKLFLTKNLRLNLIILTVLILFNLSFSLYFILDVTEFFLSN